MANLSTFLPYRIDPTNVSFSGGSIDGVSLGSTTPVTSFTSTGIDDNATSTALTLDSGGNPDFRMGAGPAAGTMTLRNGGDATGAVNLNIGDANNAGGFLNVLDQNGTVVLNSAGGLSVENALGASLTFSPDDGTGPSEAMRITAAGEVGIGTDSPLAPLHFDIADPGNNSVTPILGLSAGNDTAISSIAVVRDSLSNNLGLAFNVNTNAGGAAEAMRLDSSGNLLVGTTTTVDTDNLGFQVDPLTSGAVIRVGRNASTQAALVNFYASGGLAGQITSGGTTTNYNTSSDYRLKNVTGPVQNSGQYIDALNPVEGTWKADGSVFVGLIAHEVQDVSRTAVATGEKDGEEMQAMDYSSAEIVANLIAEVQSLRQRVAQLEAS